METQRGKTQKRERKKNEARESLRERREGKEGERERGEKQAPLHKTTAVKNKHSRLI